MKQVVRYFLALLLLVGLSLFGEEDFNTTTFLLKVHLLSKDHIVSAGDFAM